MIVSKFSDQNLESDQIEVDSSCETKGRFQLWLLLCAAALAVSVSLTLLIWGLDKSFNMLDEGFAVLSATNPKGYPFYSSFHYFLSICPTIYVNQLCSLRLVHVITCVLSSIGLTAGVQHWLRSHCNFMSLGSTSWTCVYLIALIGSFIVYSVHPQILTYNGLATFFVFTAAGLSFYALGEKPTRASAVLSVLAGFFIALAFFSKFSSTIVVVTLMAAFCAICHRSRLLSVIAYSLGGVILGVLTFFTLFQSPSEWFYIQSSTVNAVSQGAHGPIAVFSNTFSSLRQHSWECAVSAIVILAMVALAKAGCFARFSDRQILIFVSILSIAFLVISGYISFNRYYYLHRSILYFGLLPPLLLLLPKLSVQTVPLERAQKAKFGLLVCLLLLLPLAVSVGTDTPLLWHAFTSFSSFYLGLALLYFAVGRVYETTSFVVLSLSFIIVITMYHFVRGFVLGPPHTESLAKQNLRVQRGPLRGLFLEPNLYNYLIQTYQILEKSGYHEGDWVLALNDGPGLIYAIGARSPGAAWYFGDPRGTSHNRYQLNLIEPTNGRLFVIVTNVDDKSLPPADVIDLLKQKGIDLLNDYALVGQVVRPFLYQSRGNTSFVYARAER